MYISITNTLGNEIQQLPNVLSDHHIRRKWMLFWSSSREFTTEVLKNTKIPKKKKKKKYEDNMRLVVTLETS